MSQFLLLDELPKLKAETMRYLTRDYDLDGILGILITTEYGNFDSAIQGQPRVFTPRIVPILPSDADYASGYREEMDDIIRYDIYPDSEGYVVKVTWQLLM